MAHGVGRRALGRLAGGRRRALRPAPDRPLRVLRRPARPVAPQRGLGPARQLPRRPDRLPAARRAPRLDRRHRGLRAVGRLPLRRRGFLRDWLVDLGLEQPAQDGLVPFVVPDALKYEEHPTEFPAPETAAIWSDAAVWVPWALWQAYGDPAVLADQYDSMVAHVSRVESLLSPSGLWDNGFQFGDWLDPQARRTGRSRPTRTTASSPRPASTGRADRGGGGRPDGTRRGRSPLRRAGRPDPRRPSRPTTSRTTASSPATRRPSTHWRSSSACSTSTRGTGAGTGSRSSSPRAATTWAPGSPGRRSSRTRSPNRAPRRQPTGC